MGNLSTGEPSPLIGVVCYGKAKDPDRYTLPRTYVEAVRRAGGRLLVIPPGDVESRSYLDILDGFILAGGGDIDPEHLVQEPHPRLSQIDPERDATELEIADAITRRPMPLLAICRGMQVLNVALGGDIIQHLAGDRVRHTKGTGECVFHTVRVADDSVLARIGGNGVWEVGSKHHQAVGRLGTGLEAIAWSEDGIVEAVQSKGHTEALGVQWHPEETAARDHRQQSLFDWLVSRATLKKSNETYLRS
jgi:putative glutamine amidotransferase